MRILVHGMLEPSWSTGILDIHDSVRADAARLHDMFTACGYVGEWDPTFIPTADDQTVEMITRTEKARSGGDDHFTIQSIRVQDTGELAGYFHVHYGLPRPEILWLSIMVIHPDFQKRGFSQQVIDGVAAQARELGYEAIWLKVYLKNHPAFRHWIKTGFTRIVEWRDENDNNGEPIAAVILERRIGEE